MVFTVIEANANIGTEKIKMKIISRETLSDYQKDFLQTLKRDEVIKYGKAMGWTVLDISEWE